MPPWGGAHAGETLIKTTCRSKPQSHHGHASQHGLDGLLVTFHLW